MQNDSIVAGRASRCRRRVAQQFLVAELSGQRSRSGSPIARERLCSRRTSDASDVLPNFRHATASDCAVFQHTDYAEKTGAGEGIRTLDPDLGKVVLYP